MASYFVGVARPQGDTRKANNPKETSLSADRIKTFKGKHATAPTERDTQTCFLIRNNNHSCHHEDATMHVITCRCDTRVVRAYMARRLRTLEVLLTKHRGKKAMCPLAMDGIRLQGWGTSDLLRKMNDAARYKVKHVWLVKRQEECLCACNVQFFSGRMHDSSQHFKAKWHF